MAQNTISANWRPLKGRYVIPLEFGQYPVPPWARRDVRRGVNVPHNLQRLLHDSYAHMCSIVDKTCNVIFGHFGELLLEQAFETRKDNRTLSGGIVVDHSVFDLTISLFHHCRL